MPSFKLKGKAQEVKSGFEPYDGPEPTRNGMYRAVIKVIKHGLNSSKSEGFSITLELQAAPGDPKGHAQYDGFPMFSRSIITDTADGSALKEGAQRNLDNFLAALGTGDNPDVVLAEGDGDKVDVKKIGGRNPVGAVVNIDLQMKNFEGERRPEVGGIYPYKEIDAPTGKGRAAALVVEDDEPEDDEADLMEGSDEAEGDDDEYTAREEELNGLGIPALKKIAKELEIGISGTKAALVERILDAEFAEEDDSAEDEEEPEDADEADEAEDDEAEDEDEPDDEEEDEDDAEREARVAELDAMGRPALKAVLKEIAPDFTVLKRHTDDNLREQIISVEFSEDLPF